MARNRCDGCDRRITVTGGRENVWVLDGRPPRGLQLELPDGTEHLLCFECITRLPDDPTGVDVWRLSTEHDA
ncbi:MAG: DUF7561 family protein [Halobacteriota archaeon]